MKINKNIIHRNPIRQIIVFIIALFSFVGAFANKYPSVNSSYLDSVDYYLKRATLYTHQALSHINGSLASLDSLPTQDKLNLLAETGRRLEQIDIDSAMWIYDRGAALAHEIDDHRFSKIFTFRKASAMPMKGLVREGIDTFLSVSADSLAPSDRYDYYASGRHIFDAAVDYYRVDSLRQKYERLSSLYTDSVLMYAIPGSINQKYYAALSQIGGGQDNDEGINEMLDVIDSVEITDPIFAKGTAVLASAYLREGDIKLAKYYLALSAISDLRSGTREATSIHRLGKLLKNEDDFPRAFEYLTYALESSVASGSHLRTIEIGEIMPMVVRAGRELEKQQNRNLSILVIYLSITVIVFVVLVVFAFHTRNRLRRMQRQLVSMNDSKDRYIRELLSLCGAYLDALENFNKLAGRKIKVGQINDLLVMIESGKVIREQLQSFYEVFDDAFLAVYPDFVERVNELLLPDKQLSLTVDGRLGTELRIVAFMRLGLEDSTRIAKFLGLSLNTIYTYRNKVKTRARNRETFEKDIVNIDRDFN